MVSLPGVRVVALSVLAAASAAPVLAQCSTSWLPGTGLPGTDGVVLATTRWDPDGPGPAAPLIVLGGRFSIAGSVASRGLATFDPASGQWGTLGSLPAGTNVEVKALAVLPGGDLVIGGSFPSIAGVAANNVARWNGASWSPLGSGTGNAVHALTSLPSGDVVAGGPFVVAGGVNVNRVARWDGSSWSPLGVGPTTGAVNALSTLPNGDVLAAGTFATIGAVQMNGIARWDGTAWQPLGTGLGAGATVNAITRMPNGDVIATGFFSFTDPLSVPATCVARWDGTNWFGFGFGLAPSSIDAAAALPNGALVVGGDFFGGASTATYVARWSGTAWTPIDTGTNGPVKSLLVLPLGDLFAAGDFSVAGSSSALRIARWNSLEWLPLANSASSGINAMATLPGGDVVVGGSFVSIGGVTANRVARYDGGGWHAIGAGFDGAVKAVAVRGSGEVFAGGTFTASGGVTMDNIARWDGTGWTSLGTGTNGAVNALAVLPNGDLVAGGTFTSPFANVARWDGSAWTAMPGLAQPLVAFAVLPNGDLAAASPDTVRRWNGATWTPLGFTFTGAITSLTVSSAGELVVGGAFTVAGGVGALAVARWNGTIWQPIGSGFAPGATQNTVRALQLAPNGDLVAAGSFALPVVGTTYRIARWNGTAWTPLAADQNGPIVALATRPGGDLVAAGAFTIVGGQIAAYFGRIASSCPASIASLGTGCAGSGGLDVLAPQSLPWAGATFRALATGMPLSAFAVGVTGFGTTSLSLQSVLPQALAGCSLFATPDVVSLLAPSGGSVQMDTPIPASPALAGQVLHQQVVPFELGAGGVAAVTSTNALSLTIGVF